MSAGSVTAAMTRTGAAQRGQYLKSIANTRRTSPGMDEVERSRMPEPRRCIQVMGAVGEVLSREIIPSGCRRGNGPGRQHGQARYREPLVGPCRSETLCMHDNLHAREPGDPSNRPWQLVAVGGIGEAEP